MKQVVIIGAGLSGLTAAYLLKKKGIETTIVEARNRYGGRIYTEYADDGTPVEMGATWLSSQHEQLLALMKELDVHVFPQAMEGISLFEAMSMAPPQPFHIPENTEPSFRIQKGSSSIIEALVNQIGETKISLNTIVSAIDFSNSKTIVHTSDGEMGADIVINTIPPHLTSQSIQFKPDLPSEVHHLALATQTWMAGSVKFAVSYKTPFWRADGLSGTAFSNAGIAGEIYDHANVEDDRYALLGFLGEGAHSLSNNDRKEKVFAQLEKYFGSGARDCISYHEVLWKNEIYTGINNDTFLSPHQNNGHDIYLKGYFNNRFYFCGTETSPTYPGYMEGAILSAQRTMSKI